MVVRLALLLLLFGFLHSYETLAQLQALSDSLHSYKMWALCCSADYGTQ
jgi:hypothetical protein